MPPENSDHFYGDFEERFLQIRRLFAQNKKYLDEQVFAPLIMGTSALSGEKAEELLEFSDHLA